MKFRSKRTRAEARQNETTEETDAQHTIVEENGNTNDRNETSSPQFTTMRNRITSIRHHKIIGLLLQMALEVNQEAWKMMKKMMRIFKKEMQALSISKIPDWKETIKFDEQEKVQIRDKDGNSKSRGGTILPSHVWSLPPGERFVVPFNDFYRPLRKGGHILVWFLGDIARNGDWCPIGEINWHRVHKVYKADIVTMVRQNFVLPPHEIIDNKLLRCVGKAWRNHKCKLKKKHKLPGKTQQAVIDDMSSNLIKDQWIKHVNYWFSPKARKHVVTKITITQPEIRVYEEDEYAKENGRKPGPLEFYEASYKRKDGSYEENSASKDFVETAKPLIAERATDTTSTKDVENEVFNELMYGSTSEQDKKY